MTDDEKFIVTLEEDMKYFRVVVKHGTHKLHSEKMNLETAFDLAYKYRRKITGY